MNLLHNEVESILTPGVIVQHYKRADYVRCNSNDPDYDKNKYLYQVCGIATDTDTESKHYVIYQALYGRREVYARRIEEYIGCADVKRLTSVETLPRFTLYREPVELEPTMVPTPPKKHNQDKKLHKKIKSLSDEVKKLREENDQLKKEATAKLMNKKYTKKPAPGSNDPDSANSTSYLAEAEEEALKSIAKAPEIKQQSIISSDLTNRICEAFENVVAKDAPKEVLGVIQQPSSLKPQTVEAANIADELTKALKPSGPKPGELGRIGKMALKKAAEHDS